MKRCPVCGETYDDKVDFCFSDGAPLESVDASADPTALPEPKPAEPASAPAPAESSKGKRPRRGMFGRPSVADMLSVAEPGGASAGGVRVKADAEKPSAPKDSVVRPR